MGSVNTFCIALHKFHLCNSKHPPVFLFLSSSSASHIIRQKMDERGTDITTVAGSVAKAWIRPVNIQTHSEGSKVLLGYDVLALLHKRV